METLSGKVAVVTGGASGIGEATARLLASHGAKVIVADIDMVTGNKVASDIGNGIALYLDVTQEAAWNSCISEVMESCGRIDILINNAGTGTGGFIENEPVEGHRRTMDVNVTGVWLGMRAVLPAMKSQRGGSIVNISSIDGLVGVAQLSSYSASKFAVTGMTKSVALESGQFGVRVNSVHPGFISTPMFNRSSPGKNKRYEDAIARQPIARAGEAEEVARAILFLASEDSSYCTGSSLVVDGGHTAGPYRVPL